MTTDIKARSKLHTFGAIMPPGGPDQDAVRYHAFDALRGVAMLLGVVLHASICYRQTPVPGLFWLVYDAAPFPFFDWLSSWIHSFRMPLFFVLAGFFAVLSYDRGGPRKYLVRRSRRLLIPFLVACVTILPLTLAASRRYDWNSLRHLLLRPGLHPDIVGPGPFWFLEYLFLICVLYWLFRQIEAVWTSGREEPIRLSMRSSRWLVSPYRPLLFAVPTAAILWIEPSLAVHVRATFVPEPLRVLYFGAFFAVGTRLGRYRVQLGRLVPWSNVYLALSIPLLILSRQLMLEQLAGRVGTGQRFVLVVSYALLAWLSIFGYLGLFLRFFHQRQSTFRYLADASYWIYIFHLPVVVLTQVALVRVPGWAVVKFLAVTGVALLLGLTSYQWLVCPTFIGAILDEPRRRLKGAAGGKGANGRRDTGGKGDIAGICARHPA
jgi:glucan biosynthesis protein C